MKRKLNLFPLLVVAFIFFALNAYVLSGLGTINQSTWLSPIFWVFTVGLSFALLYAIQQMRIQGMNRFFQIISHAFLIVFTAELVFAIFLLVGDIYRLLLGLSGSFGAHGFHISGRSSYWVDFAFVMFCLTIALFAYGITQGKYAYRVIKHTLYFDDLPASFDGFTLTQISDVHAGSFTNPKAVQKGIDLINAQKSDLFVFTGDLVRPSWLASA